MDDVYLKREQLKKLYPTSDRWQKRCDAYPDNQILAIWFRMKMAGKIN